MSSDEQAQLVMGDAHATLLQLDVLRLVCQPRPQSFSEEEEQHWVIGLFPPLEEKIDERVVHVLVGDFVWVSRGYFVGGSIRALFVTTEQETTEESTFDDEVRFLRQHALWANQAMWDHLATALRTMLALAPTVGSAFTIPALPPTLSLKAPHSDSVSSEDMSV